MSKRTLPAAVPIQNEENEEKQPEKVPLTTKTSIISEKSK
jgi:hypothetical protein